MPNSSKKVKKKGPGAPTHTAVEEVEQRYFLQTLNIQSFVNNSLSRFKS